jgi:hypothetical protein
MNSLTTKKYLTRDELAPYYAPNNVIFLKLGNGDEYIGRHLRMIGCVDTNNRLCALQIVFKWLINTRLIEDDKLGKIRVPIHHARRFKEYTITFEVCPTQVILNGSKSVISFKDEEITFDLSAESNQAAELARTYE